MDEGPKEQRCLWLIANPGKVLGALLGLLLGVFFLTVGFWRTLLLFSLSSLGLYIGSRYDRRESLKDLLDRILPPRS